MVHCILGDQGASWIKGFQSLVDQRGSIKHPHLFPHIPFPCHSNGDHRSSNSQLLPATSQKWWWWRPETEQEEQEEEQAQKARQCWWLLQWTAAVFLWSMKGMCRMNCSLCKGCAISNAGFCLYTKCYQLGQVGLSQEVAWTGWGITCICSIFYIYNCFYSVELFFLFPNKNDRKYSCQFVSFSNGLDFHSKV